MLQRFLLIGVGGSGGKTLRYTWRELDRRLKATGWTGGVPAAWRFLHLDVPEHPDVIEGDVPATMGRSARYLGMAQYPRQYAEYDHELCSREELLPAIAGWRPDPRLDYAPPYLGAGQRRVVGRVIALTQLDEVGDSIDRAVSALADTEVTDELKRLNRHLGFGDVQTNVEPATCVVFSSLGGGAGSGAFLDVIELLLARATEQAEWLARSLVTVLFAADVFAHLNPQQRAGVEPNSLAAISELLAAHEHQGAVHEREAGLLRLGGGTLQVRGRRIGATNFIIGAKNEAVSFDTSLAVFRAVGKAFATFMTDDNVQRQFVTYINTNPSAPSVTRGFRITDADAMSQPCSSFGYANVSLGRSLFAEYATERLAKRALDRLLRGHREGVPEGEFRRDDKLISEMADGVKESFFDHARLWELSSGHNQVLDALRDRAQKDDALAEAVAGVRERLKRDGRKLPPVDWFKDLTARYDDVVQAFEAAERAQRTQNAIEWVDAIQDRVLDTTAAYAGRYGIPVTTALLERLEAQLRDAAKELRNDSHHFTEEQRSMLNRGQQLFREIRERVILSNHPSFDGAADYRRDALDRRTEAELFTFTADLLDEFVSGFLPALRQAMRGAEGALAASEAREERDLVAQWSAGSVPAHLRAAPTELLLEEENGFPATLDALLQSAFDKQGAENAQAAALEEIITRSWPSKFADAAATGHQRLIKQSRRWRPAKSEARAPSESASNAGFDVALLPSLLREWASEWVRDRRGPVAEHVHGTLAEWLSPTHPDAADRADRFVDRVDQALGLAAPLVSINPRLYQVVHGGDPPQPALLVSKIPLEHGHRARDRVQTRLEAAGLSPGDVATLLDPNAQGAAVEISSFVGRSVHPIVFDSLLGPVQRDWNRRSDAGGRSQFWAFRRSRTLTAFVPLSPTRQLAFVRGWLVATFLGHVGALEGRWSEDPLDVWTPRGRKRFPRHLLGGDPGEPGDVLPRLMESLPLALLTFASGSSDELEAYMRLLDLGSQENGALNPELAGWISGGKVSEPEPDFERAPVPDEATAGARAGSVEARAETIVTNLRAWEEGYRKAIGDKRITVDTSLRVGPGWEIRQLASRAALGLADAIERVPGRPEPKVPGLAIPTS
jgi:hypothetical protein